MVTRFDVSSASPAAAVIPLSEPVLRGNEWRYVKECLDSNWVSSAGPFVDRFERNVADFLGVRHGVATASGTAALHTALLVAGVQPNDEVLVSTLTFIASANAIRHAGAWPVFIDAEPLHWQMDINLLERFLTRQCAWRNGALRNLKTNRRVHAIVPVHILGHAVDMDPLLDLARKFNLLVIEDAAESIGAHYKGRPVGTLGDIACLSFNGNKTITTGGGGMVVTNDERWATHARYLTNQAKDDPEEYIHHHIGYNYRLTNLLAALGCAQLEALPAYIDAKRRIASIYARGFENTSTVQMFSASTNVYCTFWLSTIQVDGAAIAARTLRGRLKQQRIESRTLWQPMHRSPAHQGADAVLSGVADRIVANGLSLPSSVQLTDEQVTRVIEVIAQAL